MTNLPVNGRSTGVYADCAQRRIAFKGILEVSDELAADEQYINPLSPLLTHVVS